MQPYVPNKLPLERLDWTKVIRLIGQANAELARYDGILQGIVNPQVSRQSAKWSCAKSSTHNLLKDPIITESPSIQGPNDAVCRARERRHDRDRRMLPAAL